MQPIENEENQNRNNSYAQEAETVNISENSTITINEADATSTKSGPLSSLLESNRVISFQTTRTLDEAIAWSKEHTETINLSKRVVDVNEIQLISTELAINTYTRETRESLCEYFGLRKTSHTTNREEIVYVLVFDDKIINKLN